MLTTCAVDYLTWENSTRPGLADGGRRCPCAASRWRGGARRRASTRSSLEGPLLRAHRRRGAALDRGARAGHARARRPPARAPRATTTRSSSSPTATGRPTTACRSRPAKSILVPTAEDDGAVRLRLFQPFFRLPARLRVQLARGARAAAARDGRGRPARARWWASASRTRRSCPPDEIRRRLDLLGDYVVYVGRIEREKGCARLFDDFLRYVQERAPHLNLVLVGQAGAAHPRARERHAPGRRARTRRSCPSSARQPAARASQPPSRACPWRCSRPGRWSGPRS